MRMLIALFAALIAASPALAGDRVTLNSEVFIERQVTEANGRVKTVLEPPKVVTPGDRLVFVLAYKNEGDAPANDFTVTNPIPGAVLYADRASAGAVVSVDGGKSWGPIGGLKVRAADGTMRPAGDADVTHVRWTLAKPVPAGAGGKLQFHGVVR